MSWTDRAESPSPVPWSRARSGEQAKLIIDAARRLVRAKGSSFTTQELVKEAGVALQTFYRNFGGKDQLLLAVIEDLVTESCAANRQQAEQLDGPVDRLRFYVTQTLSSLDGDGGDGSGPRFITTEHWRLHQIYPDELGQAVRPFTDLILEELLAAIAAGQLKSSNPPYDAWLITELVMAVYHHYAFAASDEPSAVRAERLWGFCFRALGGRAAASGHRSGGSTAGSKEPSGRSRSTRKTD
jgi:TetR/AcrR family transcriptional regulator